MKQTRNLEDLLRQYDLLAAWRPGGFTTIPPTA